MEKVIELTNTIIDSLVEHDIILTDHDTQLAWELIYNKLAEDVGK